MKHMSTEEIEAYLSDRMDEVMTQAFEDGEISDGEIVEVVVASESLKQLVIEALLENKQVSQRVFDKACERMRDEHDDSRD